MTRQPAIVIIGVAGSGKSTLSEVLAERIGGRFIEGDDYHPPANRIHMKAGVPLTDADREPWLRILREAISTVPAETPAVVACSALKQSYRETLSASTRPLTWVYLKIEPDEIRARFRQRTGHFMPAELIDSQFADLEEPQEALTVDATCPISDLVDAVLERA